MERRDTYKVILYIIFVLFTSTGIQAKVKLPHLINNGMILQREMPLKIWGWASPGEKVKVIFGGKQYDTKADKNGGWHIELPSFTAGGPYIMQVNDIHIKDILIGDVWLCSGQSNIELPIHRVLDLYRDEVQDANNPQIRQFRVPMKYNFQHEEADLQGGEWKSVTPENVLDFSAVAYFFAKDINDKYGIPIGLINTGVGGSPAEAWISEESLKNYLQYLEAIRICATPGYIDSVRNAELERGNRWHTELNQKDKGVSLWNKKEFDDSEWDLFSLPGYWADGNIGEVNGSLWFRKDVDIPASMAEKPGILRLGRIIDADSVFINSTFVGSVSYQYPPRIYNIPAKVLKEGRNNLTIRVISNSGRGGFVKEKPYKIIVGDNEIDLTGDWKYRVGAEIPPADPQTFFQYKPAGLYNGMIAPLKNYALKGFLWYQGEANTSRAAEYENLLSDLINDWRDKWNNPQMPFVYVQLPNFMKERKQPSESGWAEVREAQRQVLKLPNTGMAVTIDAGEWNDIHPLNKKTVGERLALEARRIIYGDNRIISTGPIYESMETEGKNVILTFSSVGSGIYSNIDLSGFSIAGFDKKYVWANAVVLSHNKIKVWSSEVQNPVSVRYAWADNPVGANLKNKEGLPASPFTTEQPDITRIREFNGDLRESVIDSDTILTENKVGIHNGFDYELWYDRGDVSMILKESGRFKCNWNNINNVLFRTGKKFNSTKTHDEIGVISLNYNCLYQPDGNSYLCVYGRSVDPLVEFYVVDAWGSWRPPGSESKGTVEINGGTYDIYETTRIEQPSIQGKTTFQQYWSVRTDKKNGGTVSVSEHFKAWEKPGMKLGKIYEIALCVEGYQSKGTANIYNHILIINNTAIGTEPIFKEE